MNDELKISPEFMAGIKELARKAVMLFYAYVIAWVPNLLSLDLTQNQRLLLTVVLTPFIAAFSEFLHKIGIAKEKETSTPSKLTQGLTPFIK